MRMAVTLTVTNPLMAATKLKPRLKLAKFKESMDTTMTPEFSVKSSMVHLVKDSTHKELT